MGGSGENLESKRLKAGLPFRPTMAPEDAERT